jgi:hypothetical protein
LRVHVGAARGSSQPLNVQGGLDVALSALDDPNEAPTAKTIARALDRRGALSGSSSADPEVDR